MAVVDVIIPNYRYARYLSDCVESIVTQGIQDIRLLIIDNASDDDSIEVAHSLAKKDSRIELMLREANLGPHASLNDGIRWASSPFVIFVHADDLLAPGCLPRALSIMEKHPEVAFVYGREILWRENEEQRPQLTVQDDPNDDYRLLDAWDFIYERSLPPVKLISAGALLVRTNVQKQAGFFRPELVFTDDLEMMFRLSLAGFAAELSETQGIRRLHGDNLSSRYWNRLLHEIGEIDAAYQVFFHNEGRAVRDVRGLSKLVQRNLANRAYWSAVSHALRGHNALSPALFEYAFGKSPRTRFLPPIDHLFRAGRSFQRTSQVLKESLRRFSRR